MIMPVSHSTPPPLPPPAAADGQIPGSVMDLFLQLLTQVQGQQTATIDLEGALPSLPTPAPDTLEREALESILLALHGIVPYLAVALPAEELQALPGSLPQGSSHTQFGVNVRQAATSLPGANLLAPYPGQSTGMAQPEAVIPTTADGVSSAAVLSLPMGNLPQAGEEGTRVFSMPGTATLLQTDKLKLAESPALEPVGVLSQPSTDISVRPPEDVPESLAPRGHHTALEAVTRQVGPLPRHTILLQLEPPELGHVRVQIRLLDERLAAAFWADSSEVRALLQAHLPMLHQALNQQGFQTHQLSITPSIDGSVDTAGQFAHQHSAFQQFAQEGERRTLDSIRVPLASQELLTYKNEHNGLVNVVI